LTARRFVPVADVARAHGIRGEVRLKLYQEGSDLLRARPTLRLRLPDGTERAVKLETVRTANKAMLVKFAGVEDRDAAEALHGAALLVPRDEFPPLEEGEFYACDIEGARVLLPSGELVGRVEELVTYPTCDVLVIDREQAGKLEVPLLDGYVESVDVEEGVVRLVTIEGLG
jgi:16S rRNA processing protein RimM